MHDIVTSQSDWETTLAPRILLGLWHPRFLPFAKHRLPYCRRSYIGYSVAIARKHFWKDCHAFSISFASLTTADGQKFVSRLLPRMHIHWFLSRFRQECKVAGKNIMVWTVNEPAHMMEVRRISSWFVWVVSHDELHRLWDGVSMLSSLMLQGRGWIFGWLCTVRVLVLFPYDTFQYHVFYLCSNFRWLREVCIWIWKTFLVGPAVLFAYSDVPTASGAACYWTCCWTIWWIHGLAIYCWIKSLMGLIISISWSLLEMIVRTLPRTMLILRLYRVRQ